MLMTSMLSFSFLDFYSAAGRDCVTSKECGDFCGEWGVGSGEFSRQKTPCMGVFAGKLRATTTTTTRVVQSKSS